ncbi:hypothetical protein OESDEN_10654 [Oesophagostomum dentatum]|uniref:Uncharacterized protein n=1 Tax=Oesophagostomum dentatum TaxID=61180 RepID=A0A0B1SX28_OESDE|nr:hypothetical protein OESDEN_10654 [Oesophagostomum dentatum]
MSMVSVTVGDFARFQVNAAESPRYPIFYGYVFSKYCKCVATYGVGEYRSVGKEDYYYVVNVKDNPNPHFPSIPGYELVNESPAFFVNDTKCESPKARYQFFK